MKKNENLSREALIEETISSELTIRPKTFKEYIGQERMKKNVSVIIESAKIQNKPPDHFLFYGPPGLGKTTIAGIIANEMNSNLKIIAAPSIEKPGDLISSIMTLERGDILFIDEIHRIPKIVEEVLYSVMEDFSLDIVVEDGNSSKTIHLDVPKFTLVGATTRVGMLSAPLRDRFGSINRLEPYTKEELSKIVIRDAEILRIGIEPKALEKIAVRARGTPRIAIRLLKRLQDYAVVMKSSIISEYIADYALKLMSIDEQGLDDIDISVIKAIHQNFNDGPVGVETLASFINEDVGTLVDVSEPYLMQIGLLAKTPRGRILTEKGINYIVDLLNLQICKTI